MGCFAVLFNCSCIIIKEHIIFHLKSIILTSVNSTGVPLSATQHLLVSTPNREDLLFILPKSETLCLCGKNATHLRCLQVVKAQGRGVREEAHPQAAPRKNKRGVCEWKPSSVILKKLSTAAACRWSTTGYLLGPFSPKTQNVLSLLPPSSLLSSLLTFAGFNPAGSKNVTVFV